MSCQRDGNILDKYLIMKILITGANGQLGRELRPLLETDFPGMSVYTDIAELDLTDAKAVEAFVINNEITHIVNCAAYTAVDRAEEEKMQCAGINTDAVKNLAAAADICDGICHVRKSYTFPPTMYLTGQTTGHTRNRIR